MPVASDDAIEESQGSIRAVGSSPRPGAEPKPLAGATLFLAGIALAFSNFMVVLDITIANVSVPNIAGGLAVSPNEGTWVITSYSVAEAITMPLTGWLAHRFGSVRVFVSAMVGFALCSALCGMSSSLGMLVFFRILQGLAGGPMVPLSQVLMLRVFPKEKAGQAMGLWGMTTVVGPIAGPILGGQLCDNWGWPWIFFINLPGALFCAFLAWRVARRFETPIIRRRLDVTGLLLLIVWVGALEVMLDKGEEMDWFNSTFILGLLAVTLVFLSAFLIWVLTDSSPIVNLRVFMTRGYLAAALVIIFGFGAYFASVVLIPLWLQTNMGYTSSWAGIAVAPQGMLAVVMAPVVGFLIGKVDTRIMVSAAILWIAAWMFWRVGFASNVGLEQIWLPQLAQGFAVPFFFIPIFGLAIGSLRPDDAPGGAGLLNFMRTIGGAFAVSLTTTAWSDAGIADRVALLNQPNGIADFIASGGAGFGASQTIGQIDSIVQNQSVMLATNHMFMIIGSIMTFAAVAIWLAPKPTMSPGGGGH